MTSTLNHAVDEAVPEGKHVIHELDGSGDVRTVWDPEDEADVEMARNLFKKAMKAGRVAYAVKRNGDKGEVVKEFDPSAEKLIFAPAMAGG